MRILFDDIDLSRIRITPGLDPIREVQAAAHRRLRHGDPAFGEWAATTHDRLGPLFGSVMGTMRSGPVQIGSLNAGVTGYGTFDDRLDRALSEPRTSWTRLGRQMEIVGTPMTSDLVAGSAPALRTLETAVRHFHGAALAPHWGGLIATAAAVSDAWAGTLAQHGVEALFRSLHPDIRWVPPALEITVGIDMTCPPGCLHQRVDESVGRTVAVGEDGLAIIVSVFGDQPLTIADVTPDGVVVASALSVPVPIDWRLLTGPTTRAVDQLARLLGSTRSWVLLACLDQPATTSQIARAVGVSVSSVSEHAAVLRDSGLITATRDRNCVLHEATTLGRRLVLTTRIGPARPATTNGFDPVVAGTGVAATERA